MAAFSADIMALLFLLTSTVTSFHIALHWCPQSSNQEQLMLEAEVETMRFRVKTAYGVFLFSSFILIFGIANIFHEDIPGAMCGTGVFQAMEGQGSKLLLYRFLIIILLHGWYELDKINRDRFDMPMTDMNARLFLVIPVVTILAVFQTHESFAVIDSHRPVDCCAVVYDQFTSLKQAKSFGGLDDQWWLGGFSVLSALLIGLSFSLRFFTLPFTTIRDILTVIILLWLPVSALTLVNILAAYYYGVLHHHCPWCLFLPEYHLVGYPIYGSMMLVGMEGVLVFFLPRMTRTYPDVSVQVAIRCKKAFKRIFIGGIVFLLLSVGPAIIWRWHYGVWMTG